MSKILIVGAGPVGMVAAIELAKYGMQVRIIDKKLSRDLHSKALAINPHTLDLLESTHISEKLIAASEKVKKIILHVNNGNEINLDISAINHRYNFLLVLPQSETESILEQNLQKLGINIEWNVELLSFNQDKQFVKCLVKDQYGSSEYIADYLIGADGAHSTVRHCAGISFKGKSYENEWFLADIQHERVINNSQVNIFLFPNQKLIVLIPIKQNLMRVISNQPIDLSALPLNLVATASLWESTFKINNRQVSTYQQGRIFLAGDAAHLHSPVGGRGMNLGIEDAVVLASLINNRNTDRYTKLRKATGKRVIEATDIITRIMGHRHSALVFIRDKLLFPLLSIPAIQRKIAKKMMGL